MVLALINTVFAQDSQDAAIAQWRVVADQVPKKFPKLAVLIYDPESNVRSGGPNGIGDHHAGYELIGASQRGDQIAARVGGRRCYDSDVFRRIDVLRSTQQAGFTWVGLSTLQSDPRRPRRTPPPAAGSNAPT
jgi:hypothetical protein